MKKTFTANFFAICTLFALATQSFAQSAPLPSAHQVENKTDEEIAEEYFISYITALNKTQKRLKRMNTPGTLSKLGEEKIDGFASGTLQYKTKIKGLGAVITLVYTNYSDDGDWIFDGTIIVTSNMMANGTMAGTISVSGANAGKVFYDDAILKKGVPGGGFYAVELPNLTRTPVPYSAFFKAEEYKIDINER